MHAMARAPKQSTPSPWPQRWREGILILSGAVSLFLLLALFSYHHHDPAFGHLQTVKHPIQNIGGRIGAWFADGFLYLFGYLAFIFPLMLVYSTWLYYQEGRSQKTKESDYLLLTLRGLGFVLFMLAGCGLASLHAYQSSQFLYHSGGVIGHGIDRLLVPLLSRFGSFIILFALLMTSITLISGLSWIKVFDVTGRYTLKFSHSLTLFLYNFYWDVRDWWILRKEERENREPIVVKPKEKKSNAPFKKIEPTVNHETLSVESPIKPHIETRVTPIKPSKRALQEKQGVLFDGGESGQLPALSLLDQPPTNKTRGYSASILEKMSREVEEHLKDFGVEVQVVAVHPGPVITRFELQLAPGLKVSKISALAKDLARSLSVVSVRIVEVIPGKPVVGLEVPNVDRETVYLSEVLSSQQYEQARSPLSIALGKDIAGLPVIVDLAKMPHLLVAGTTGSGKSVCINAMLMSLLYKATPEEARMIMIDPKMLELSIYDDIPHLLTPVVTDMKEAANALRWCVAEMDRRYRLMAALGVRNLAGYNSKVREAIKKEKPIVDPLWKNSGMEESAPTLEALPYIVVVVDEFADMMMVVGKKVEQLIARIAQKARAAGIHMILATQRPSVDVITGLIKANVPTRIAFQVSSRIDSRTIIDQQGAEQLLGHGDMLYLPPGAGIPVRIHGAFVSDNEVHKVVEELRKQGTPNYLDDVLSMSYEADLNQPLDNSEDDQESDPLYDQAVQIVIETRRASISSIQRRLKIGYNRAARMVEAMEQAGLVSSMETNGTREVLIPENH
ncbi:MAG: DNA translocase FtsK 4TM domain-containing protein [Legionellales bacterium]|nr:DNA translocase FtsK 4TM domain-containing protein [Legionellales bacterium]